MRTYGKSQGRAKAATPDSWLPPEPNPAHAARSTARVGARYPLTPARKGPTPSGSSSARRIVNQQSLTPKLGHQPETVAAQPPMRQRGHVRPRTWPPGPQNIALILKRRETHGHAYFPTHGLAKVPADRNVPLSKCMPEHSRSTTILLGFSRDGEHIVSCSKYPAVPSIEFWRWTLPLCVSRRVDGSGPCWTLPVGNCSSWVNDSHGLTADTSESLSVFQSKDGAIVMVVLAPPPRDRLVDLLLSADLAAPSPGPPDAERAYLLTISPAPGPTLGFRQHAGLRLRYIAPGGARVSPPSPGDLSALPGGTYLVVVNTSDSVRLLEVGLRAVTGRASGSGLPPPRRRRERNAWGEESAPGPRPGVRRGQRSNAAPPAAPMSPPRRRASPSIGTPDKTPPDAKTVIEPSPDWWGALPPLETEAHMGGPARVSSELMTVQLLDQRSFDVEVFVRDLLQTRRSTRGAAVADYDLRPVRLTGDARGLILCLVLRLEAVSHASPAKADPAPGAKRRKGANEAGRRPPEDEGGGPKCIPQIIGYVLELDHRQGRVMVLNTFAQQDGPGKQVGTLCLKLCATVRSGGINGVPAVLPEYCLTNAAVLRGEPMRFLVNPVYPIAIRNDAL